MSRTTVDLDELVKTGFIEVYEHDSNLLAKPALREEKRREEKKPPNPLSGGNGVAAEKREPRSLKSDVTDPPAAEMRKSLKSDAALKSAVTELPGFNQFWSEWPSPHPRKKGKTKCQRKWERDDLERITEKVIAVLRLAKASSQWRKQGGQFIPAPIVWLGDTPWETDLAELADPPGMDETPAKNAFDFDPVDPTPEQFAAFVGEGNQEKKP